MNGPDIELHIDGIALASMPVGGERRLREAVEQELARIIGGSRGETAWPAPPSERERPRAHDGSDGRSSEAVAARVGREVHVGIAREPQR